MKNLTKLALGTSKILGGVGLITVGSYMLYEFCKIPHQETTGSSAIGVAVATAYCWWEGGNLINPKEKVETYGYDG